MCVCVCERERVWERVSKSECVCVGGGSVGESVLKRV